MPSYLEKYPSCADKREERFVYSVNSFLKQRYRDSELIIISDGCPYTEKIYNKNFKNNNNIKFVKKERTNLFSGDSRNIGIDIADGEFVCFLDTDDFIGNKHLEILASQDLSNKDWFYYDDYLYYGNNCFRKRVTKILLDQKNRMIIGSCSIVYKREIPIKWEDGYGHDHVLIRKLLNNYSYSKIIKAPEYFICHVPAPGKMFDIKNPYCFSV